MRDKINILIAFILLGGFGWSLYQVYLYIIFIFTGLPKEIVAPIIAGSFAVLVSLITVYLSKYLERKSTIEQEQRQQKSVIYQELINNILSFIPNEANKGKEMPIEEMVKFFIKFTQVILIWGSNEVVKEWSNWRIQLINAKKDETLNSLLGLEKLLLVIRKDMGHNTKGFKQGDFLRVFINDLDDSFEKGTSIK